MSKKKIQLLQIGSEDWSEQYEVPETIDWYWVHQFELTSFIEQDQALRKRNKLLRQEKQPVEEKETTYTALLLTDHSLDVQLDGLDYLIQPYEVFYSASLERDNLSPQNKEFFRRKLAQTVDDTDPEALMFQMSKRLFIGQYGDKLQITEFEIADWFTGERFYEGRSYLRLRGNFYTDFRPIGQFRFNMPIAATQPLKLWLEYVKSDTVELQVRLSLFPSGATSEIAKEWFLDEKQLQDQVEIEAPVDGTLAISILARGEGDLKIGPFHHRFSRGNWGEFILGGQRYADEHRQEFFSYFNPGDFKPPLNVYFSGWRPAEGFEGFWMMKSLGAPFLLIVDPRLDGGSFYIGSQNYEKAFVSRIQEALDFLEFTRKELILSGISMGTFGALYYGPQLDPHAIIVGKPLVNLGDVAKNERLNRPNGFPTSLDVLQSTEGGLDQQSVASLNDRFWERFSTTHMNGTLLAMSYMKQDDYDDQAFYQLVEASQGKDIQVIGRGWIGRHNDNSTAINNWFMKQYRRILATDFGRKE